MWYKAEWMGHPMRLELTLAGLLVKIVNHYSTHGALVYMICKQVQSNGRTVLFLTIQFNVSYLFAHHLNVKKLYLANRYEPMKVASMSEWNCEQLQ